MSNHATGKAIKPAIITSFKKSFESNETMPDTDEPNTFRMPISFVRCSIVRIEMPNKPIQVMNKTTSENRPKMFPNFSSEIK